VPGNVDGGEVASKKKHTFLQKVDAQSETPKGGKKRHEKKGVHLVVPTLFGVGGITKLGV